MSDTPHSFVAPEGSYTFLEEHKASTLIAPPLNAATYPTRISTITIRFQAKTTGLTALLGSVNLKDTRAKEKEKEREKEAITKDKDREGRDSYSSSDNANEEAANQESVTQDTAVNSTTTEGNGTQFAPPTLFTPATPRGRRKTPSVRKMQSIRTTSSSFVTRLQTVEGLNKLMANQSGDATFLFFNASKTLFWTQVGQKMKVRARCILSRRNYLMRREGTIGQSYLFCFPYMSRRQ
jgi:catabolite repression protein CreC